MNKWEMLGIEATKDIRLIKRAYAAKLKIYHPEEDPQGYQALREAYDWAVEQSKRIERTETIVHGDSFSGASDEWEMNEEEAETVDESVASIQRVINESDDEDRDDHEYQDNNEENLGDVLHSPPRLVYDLNLVASDPQEQVSLFMEKVEKLYADFPKRVNESYWLELLQDSVMWDISVSEDLYEEVSQFFEDNHFVPLGIWKILNQSFNWTDKFNEDPDEFKECFLEIYHRAIKCLPEYLLSYDTLLHVEGIDFDLYLQYREEIAIALVSQELDDARSSIYHAQHVFDNDPILDQLVCQYCRLAEDITWGLEVSERSIERNPQLMDMRLHQAYFNYSSGNIRKALSDVAYILLTEPTHVGAMSLEIKCYIELGELNQAEQGCNNLLCHTPNDIEAITAIALITKRRLEEIPKSNKLHRAELMNHIGMGITVKQRFKLGVQSLRWLWIIIIAAIVLQVLVVSKMPVSDGEQQNTIQVITHSDEMKTAFDEGKNIKLELKNAKYLELHRVHENNQEKFIEINEAKYRELFVEGINYVVIGYLDHESVLSIVNYEQMMQVSNTGQITVFGQLEPLVTSNLNEAFGKWASTRIETLRNSDYVQDFPVTEFYVNAQEEPKLDHADSGTSLIVYIIVLGLLYLIIFRRVWRLWRSLRYL